MTSNNKSGRKDRISVRNGIIVTGALLLPIVFLKNTAFQCDDGAFLISLFCDTMEVLLIALGASMGAMLGFEVQRHENRKNNNDTRSGQ